MKLRLTAYQEVISLDDVPAEKMREIVQEILNYLHVEIVREQTPDYTRFMLISHKD